MFLFTDKKKVLALENKQLFESYKNSRCSLEVAKSKQCERLGRRLSISRVKLLIKIGY